MIVLAQKSHQESVTNIEDFFWRMCVSYRRLNAITASFQIPFPRRNDAIIILGEVAGNIWIISLDSRQDYNQISVRKYEREKLPFFTPNDRIYTYNVMPFSPTNILAFNKSMMKDLKDK